MSIESNPPQDNKPNLDDERDIIRMLCEEQALYAACDEFEKISRIMSTLRETNELLASSAMMIGIESSFVAYKFEGDDNDTLLGCFDREGNTISHKGYLYKINYGQLNNHEGYILYLADPYNKQVHPRKPDSEPTHRDVLLSLADILRYDYTPED